MVRSLIIAALCCAAAGCKPEVEGRRSLVDGPRVLAVRSVPASAKPSDSVHYDALFVDAEGVADAESLDWALCIARKPLTETGSVSQRCLAREGSALEALGAGAEAMASVPSDACALFGPTPQTPEPGEPAQRPVDPDTTGGYYQPVRVLFPDAAGDDGYATGVTRLACGLGGATQEQAAEFTRRSQPNENPELESVVLRRGGEEEALPALDSDEVISVRRRESVAFLARWPECPTKAECGDGICSPGEDASPESCAEDCRKPVGCRGSEPYVHFDPLSRKLKDRREAMRLSWFASAGEFEHDRTGRSEAEAGDRESDNRWTAPATRGDVRLWVVLRDDRGGVGWGSYRLRVE